MKARLALRRNVPRDREGNFEPILVPKHQRSFDGFDEAILSLYSLGLTTRDIQGHLEQMYNVEVSPTLISNVTDAVCEEVKEWQCRPLDPVYPIVFFDAIVAKVRDNGKVSNRAIYLALGVNMEGQKEVLGMWSSPNEGAKFWLNMLTELQNRGLRDTFFSCVDGHSGFPEALENVYPQTRVQLCIVHMLRNSFKFVRWQERKEVAAELKNIYTAPTAEAAKDALVRFREIYDDRFPAIYPASLSGKRCNVTSLTLCYCIEGHAATLHSLRVYVYCVIRWGGIDFNSYMLCLFSLCARHSDFVVEQARGAFRSRLVIYTPRIRLYLSI